jgi:hypothetical protein
MMFGAYCCCGDCMPKFVNVEITRVGFRQLTGNSFKRWLSQSYVYDFDYYRAPIQSDYPGDPFYWTRPWILVELHYELSLVIDRYSGQFTTVTEVSNLTSDQVTTMHSQLNAVSLGSATDTASGSAGDVWSGGLMTWSITLGSPVELSEDIGEVETITEDALTIVGNTSAAGSGYWIQWNSNSIIGYPNYGNSQMIPFFPKSSTVGKTAALASDVQVLSYYAASTFLAAVGYWYFFPAVGGRQGGLGGGAGSEEDPYPYQKYPCQFQKQGATFLGLGNPKHKIARQLVQFGSIGEFAAQAICARFVWHSFDATGALTGTPSADYVGGSDGLVVFPLPEEDTLAVATSAEMTMPGYVLGGGGGCSMAP